MTTRPLLLLPLLIACSGHAHDTDPAGEGPDDSAPESCFDQAPLLIIGTGESSWEPLEPGDPLVMVHGPQNGWHMLGSVWLENILPIVEIHYTIAVKDGGALVSDNRYRVALVPVDDCVGFYPGMFGFLSTKGLEDGERDTPPELLSSEALILAMTATDLEGRTVSGSLEVLAVPDPVDAR